MFQQLLFKNQKPEIKQINKNENKQEYINKKGGSYMKKKQQHTFIIILN